MKKNIFISILIFSIACISFNVQAIDFNPKIKKELNESFLAKPCTVIITGNLHTRRSDCKTGIGSCIKIVIKLPGIPTLERGINGTIKIDPKYPNQVTVDFLYLDQEQMNENYWDLEEDFVIDDPGLKDEPGGYSSITLLKGNYTIDRSENNVGRCVVRCKATR